MVFTVTDEGGREPEHLGLSETRPNGDLGKERVPFGERRGGVEYSACGLLSLHGPIFLPKAGRTWITRGLNEEGVRRGNELSLGCQLCLQTSASASDLDDLGLTVWSED